MSRWRAFYADGRRFDSARSRWADLPAHGCVGVVVYMEPPYRRIIDGHDWVWLDADGFHDVMTHDRWGRWATAPEGVSPEMLKRGGGMADNTWAVVQAEMMAAREAPCR